GMFGICGGGGGGLFKPVGELGGFRSSFPSGIAGGAFAAARPSSVVGPPGVGGSGPGPPGATPCGTGIGGGGTPGTVVNGFGASGIVVAAERSIVGLPV